MKRVAAVAAMAVLSGTAVLAQDAPTGDAAAGEAQFGRQCVACHVVVNEEGETLAGRNARTGPNLYGIVGRQPGTVEDFNYSDSLVAYGETGVVWEEENFVAYIQDPTGFLREALDDRRARGKMAYQVRDEQQAHDIYAYLASLGGGEEAEGE
ncbi:c-type cytochrome [Wenxinia marina]|uniref:Cytochrome c2 n=1 Tax=Wenxinia marina DSM 24838 TaxID=1123501 RepID=A0A0D0Q8Q6_9RHOB|nr:c-type cytochrome [Wenxinia marina]KIQ70774.1 Cytochrome c2 [Wenxinia marina DSM 24838]GGL80263.1 cytochrome c2 [Wenxinia marina]